MKRAGIVLLVVLALAAVGGGAVGLYGLLDGSEEVASTGPSTGPALTVPTTSAAPLPAEVSVAPNPVEAPPVPDETLPLPDGSEAFGGGAGGEVFAPSEPSWGAEQTPSAGIPPADFGAGSGYQPYQPPVSTFVPPPPPPTVAPALDQQAIADCIAAATQLRDSDLRTIQNERYRVMSGASAQGNLSAFVTMRLRELDDLAAGVRAEYDANVLTCESF